MEQSKSNPFSFSADDLIADDLITTPNDETRKYKILVIEDNFEVAQNILTTLARAGMECRHTPDGLVGLEALRGKDFHLLLLDLTLPEQSGQEICRQARKISTLPLIVLMEMDEHDAQMKCFGLGADDFLIKPFASQLLLLRVVSMLRRVYIYNQKKHKHPVPISSIPIATPIRPPQPQRPAPAGVLAAISEQSSDTTVLPAGWSRCETCNYMGPTPRFRTQDGSGQPVMACPHCGDKSSIEYALG